MESVKYIQLGSRYEVSEGSIDPIAKKTLIYGFSFVAAIKSVQRWEYQAELILKKLKNE